MRKLIIDAYCLVWRLWLTNTDPMGHWREATLYHTAMFLKRWV